MWKNRGNVKGKGRISTMSDRSSVFCGWFHAQRIVKVRKAKRVSNKMAQDIL